MPVKESDVVVARGEIWHQFKHSLVGVKGLTKLAGLAKSPTETHAKTWIGWLQFDSPPPNRDCIPILPHPRKQHTQVADRAGIIRVEAKSLPIRFECVIVSVQFFIRKGKIVVGLGIG